MLRVGIVLDSFQASEWTAQVIESIKSSQVASIEVVFLTNQVASKGFSLLKVYERWDRSRHLENGDSSAPRNLAPLLHQTPAVIAREASAQIAAELDLILDLSSHPLSWKPPASPRLGLWFLMFGDPERYGSASADLFWEFYNRDAVSQVTIVAVNNGQMRMLARSTSATHKASLHLNRNPIYWKAPELVLHSVREAAAIGQNYIDQSPAQAAPKPTSRNPGIGEISALVLREFSRVMLNRLTALDARNRSKWYLAIRPRSQQRKFHDGSGYTLLQSPADRFYADPFLFEYAGKTYLFFEDFRYSDDRALISCCEVYPDGTLGPVFEILKRPYHLSYPFVFEDHGQIYMVPESRGNQTIELYRSIDFPTKWVAEPPLLSGVHAVDATIHKMENRYWMFTSMSNGLYSTCDHLCLFFADSLQGPWKAHPRNPLVTDVRHARPAGALFVDKGRLIRPSQDCGKAYGYALVFSEILKLSETEFEQRQIARIEPLLPEGHEGIHTYTRSEQFEVIDRFLAPKHFRKT